MKKFFSFLSGAIMGGLVGAVLALLLAPSSGEELRGELGDRFGGFKDEISQVMKDKRVELEAKLEELRKPAEKTS